MQQNGAIKPAAPAVVRTGWIIQVGALESESEAKQRIDLARTKASGLLSKADPFTETVVAKDNRTLYRARFAGLERDQAEAVCRTLKRADISCIPFATDPDFRFEVDKAGAASAGFVVFQAQSARL